MKRTLYILVVLVLVLSGCKSKQSVSNTVNDTNTSTETYIHDKLTPFSVPAQTASLRAMFRCDSLNNVLLTSINELKSNNIQSSFMFKDNTFDVEYKTNHDTLYVPGRDYYYKQTINKNRFRSVTLQQTIKIPIEKKLTLWQKYNLLLGKITNGLLLISLVYFILKNKKKILIKLFGN